MKTNFSITTYLIIFVLLITTSCNQSSDNAFKDQKQTLILSESDYMDKAVQMFDSIYKYFYISDMDLFMENFPRLESDNEVSWLWPYVCMAAGVNCLLDYGMTDDRLIPIIDGFEAYFDNTGVPGYASYPPAYKTDLKFYDDNAITGIELMNAYKITGNEKYLHQAKRAMYIIFTGESGECGGGVYWNESEFGKNGEKGISANGFGTYLALQLYQTTQNEQYLMFAKRIYSWINENLKNPANQIYWNGILPEDCSVRKDIWVYNTGIMILNSLLFYEITGQVEYLDEASSVGAASFKEFTETKNDRKTFINDLPWFKTVLLKAYIELAEVDSAAHEYVDLFAKDIDIAWENQRNQYGFIRADWTGSGEGGDGSFLNQCCIIEIYARLARYEVEQLKR